MLTTPPQSVTRIQVRLVYQGTREVDQGIGPGRPWCRYTTACGHLSSKHFCMLLISLSTFACRRSRSNWYAPY